jgi:ABC-2 type transport system permease protein
MAALSSGGWAGTSSLEDMERGVLDRVLVTPVRRSAVITGHLLQGALLITVQTLILASIGTLMGARYDAPVPGFVVLVAAAVLLGSSSGALSHALALTSRSQNTLIGASQAIILPLTFVSTAFLPADLMPGWMATLAAFNPLTWAVDASRLALDGGDPAQVALRLVWLTGLLVVALAVALAAFGRYRRSA